MQKQLSEIFKAYEGEKGAVITVIQKVQEKLGYLSREAISKVANNKMPDKGYIIRVCLGTGCVSGGSLNVYEALKLVVERSGLKNVIVDFTGCHGFCQRCPIVDIDPGGFFYSEVKEEDVTDTIRLHNKPPCSKLQGILKLNFCFPLSFPLLSPPCRRSVGNPSDSCPRFVGDRFGILKKDSRQARMTEKCDPVASYREYPV